MDAKFNKRQFACSLLLIALTSGANDAQRLCKKHEISEHQFATVAEPRLEAYDLSPSGKQIVALVASGDTPSSAETLALMNIDMPQVVASKALGVRLYKDQLQSSAVIFAQEGKFVIAATTSAVVYEAATLTPLRVLSDPDSRLIPTKMLSDKGVVIIAFGSPNLPLKYLSTSSLYVDVFDIQTGKLMARWPSNQAPLSLSRDGSMLTISNQEPGSNGCFGFDIVSAWTGRLVLRVASDSIFPRPGTRKVFGRLVAKFLNEDELVVTPDGSIDDSGEPLSYSFKIVSSSDAHIINELRPEHFLPTGDLEVAHAGSAFSIINRYIKPIYLTTHKRLPKETRPELLVYQNGHLSTRTPLTNLLGLRLYHLDDVAGLRMSANGSIIAVGQDYSLTFLSDCS